jgi:hypothetical protein
MPELFASGAAFSEDGKLIYATGGDDEPNALDVIDEEAGTLTHLNVQTDEDHGEFVAISRTAKGRMYLLTEGGLWSWKPGDPKAALVERPPEPAQFTDVTCNPKTGEVLVTAELEKMEENGAKYRLYYKLAADKPMVKTFLRYLPKAEIRCPVFLPDGSFLFSAEADLWYGEIEFYPADPDRKPGTAPMADLTAYRYAPIAERETDNGTPEEIGVYAIAVSRKKVYVHMHRWHGSGEGWLVRLNLPVREKDGGMGLNNTPKDSIKALKSIEKLEDFVEFSDLCGSPNGRRIYFTSSGSPKRIHYLIDNDGEVEPFRARQPEGERKSAK